MSVDVGWCRSVSFHLALAQVDCCGHVDDRLVVAVQVRVGDGAVVVRGGRVAPSFAVEDHVELVDTSLVVADHDVGHAAYEARCQVPMLRSLQNVQDLRAVARAAACRQPTFMVLVVLVLVRAWGSRAAASQPPRRSCDV